jgi:hypothetical protein
LHNAQLEGKLARLMEELRAHGGNGRSAYAKRLRAEIDAARSELYVREWLVPQQSAIKKRKSRGGRASSPLAGSALPDKHA